MEKITGIDFEKGKEEEASRVVEWTEIEEEGVWKCEYEDLKVSCSIWKHLKIEGSYLVCIRWYVKGGDYCATYIKISEDEGKEESILFKVILFLSDWKKENKDE